MAQNITKLNTVSAATIAKINGVTVDFDDTPAAGEVTALGAVYVQQPGLDAYACSFNGSDEHFYITGVAGASSASDYKGAFSVWLKRDGTGEEAIIGSSYSASNNGWLGFDASDRLYLYNETGTAADDAYASANGTVNDTNWHHVLVLYDSTQATQADRLKMWLDNVACTLTGGTFGLITLNNGISWLPSRANGWAMWLGNDRTVAKYFDGKMAFAHYCDSTTAFTPSTFGETDKGVWRPQAGAVGDYGSLGYYLDFVDSGNMGDDESGNVNDQPEINIDATNQSSVTIYAGAS